MQPEIMMVMVVAAAMALTLHLARRDPFGPLALFVILSIPTFLLRPLILALGLGEPSIPFAFHAPLGGLIVEALLLFLAALASFVIGYLAFGAKASEFAARIPTFARPMDRRRMLLAHLALVGVGMAVLVYFAGSLGGLGAYLFAARHKLFAGASILQEIPPLAGYVGAILLFQASVDRKGRLLAAGLFLGALFLTFAIGDRSAVVIPILALVIFASFAGHRIPWGKVGIGVIVLTLSLVVMQDIRSSVSPRGDNDLAAAAVESGGSFTGLTPDEFVDGINADRFDRLLLVLQDFGDGSRYGIDFLLGTINLVPRSLWESKPEQIKLGAWFSDIYTPWKSGGAPFTGLGEWWLNFGIAGVVVAHLASGFLFRTLRVYVHRTGGAAWASGLYVVTFFSLTSWGLIHTGILTQSALFLVPYLLIVLIAHPRARSLRPSRFDGTAGAAP